jgi:hypothetical protein
VSALTWFLTAALVLALAAPAGAVEPVEVEVEGVVPLTEANQGSARERAFAAALTEAVFQVSRTYLPPAQLELESEALAVRQALGPGAAGAILTYRIQPDSGPRVSATDLSQREYAVRLAAMVDASQVREQLLALGLLDDSSERPSIVLVVRSVASGPASGPDSGASGVATGLEQTLKQRLAEEDFVIVEPALRRSSIDAETALGVARALGADVAIDVALRWQERSVRERVVGGTLELRIRAQRVEDGFEIAVSRFDAPGYHEDSAQAQARAVEALQVPVGDNLLLQLERNWQALADEDRAILLVLSRVTSLAQAERVSEALLGTMGAEQVELASIAPRVVELRVVAPLSPGAIQDRLSATTFDGFRLEPVGVDRDRVELAVTPDGEPAPAPIATPPN